MKITVVSILMASAISVAAFTPASVKQASFSSTSLHSTSPSTRGEFLANLAVIAAAGGVTAIAYPGPANAGWATGPGSAVLDPKEAIIDDEILKSGPVQKALKDVADYAALVRDMKGKLQADSQVNLAPVLRKEFDFSKLRADLNTLNTAFDEETQRGTDRLIRVILQDLNELEVANTQKEGIPRSDIRVAKMAAKLEKLESAFSDYLKFAG